MTAIAFLTTGFADAVTASSASPSADGYVGSLRGLPFHIHPVETPDEWALLREAIAEKAVTIAPYTAPVISAAEAMTTLRATRDLLLTRSDWTQMADSPLGTAKKAAWATYRQALRDLPEANAANPGAATFPATPA